MGLIDNPKAWTDDNELRVVVTTAPPSPAEKSGIYNLVINGAPVYNFSLNIGDTIEIEEV